MLYLSEFDSLHIAQTEENHSFRPYGTHKRIIRRISKQEILGWNTVPQEQTLPLTIRPSQKKNKVKEPLITRLVTPIRQQRKKRSVKNVQERFEQKQDSHESSPSLCIFNTTGHLPEIVNQKIGSNINIGNSCQEMLSHEDGLDYIQGKKMNYPNQEMLKLRSKNRNMTLRPLEVKTKLASIRSTSLTSHKQAIYEDIKENSRQRKGSTCQQPQKQNGNGNVISYPVGELKDYQRPQQQQSARVKLSHYMKKYQI